MFRLLLLYCLFVYTCMLIQLKMWERRSSVKTEEKTEFVPHLVNMCKYSNFLLSLRHLVEFQLFQKFLSCTICD